MVHQDRSAEELYSELYLELEEMGVNLSHDDELKFIEAVSLKLNDERSIEQAEADLYKTKIILPEVEDFDIASNKLVSSLSDLLEQKESDGAE